jgi:hypothetical protein
MDKNDRRLVEMLLHQNRYWCRLPRSDDHGLMRAVSIVLYFTEVYHTEIQNRVLEFSLNNSSSTSSKIFESTSKELLAEFLTAPHGQKFDALNLQIVCSLYKTRFKLYYVENDGLCSEAFYPRTKLIHRVFRLPSGQYAAVFPERLKPAYELGKVIIKKIVYQVTSRRKDTPRKESYDEQARSQSPRTLEGDPSAPERRNLNESISENSSDKKDCIGKSSYKISEEDSIDIGSINYSSKELSDILEKRAGQSKPISVFYCKTDRQRSKEEIAKRGGDEVGDGGAPKPRFSHSRFVQEINDLNANIDTEIPIFEMSNLFWNEPTEKDSVDRYSKTRSLPDENKIEESEAKLLLEPIDEEKTEEQYIYQMNCLCRKKNLADQRPPSRDRVISDSFKQRESTSLNLSVGGKAHKMTPNPTDVPTTQGSFSPHIIIKRKNSEKQAPKSLHGKDKSSSDYLNMRILCDCDEIEDSIADLADIRILDILQEETPIKTSKNSNSSNSDHVYERPAYFQNVRVEDLVEGGIFFTGTIASFDGLAGSGLINVPFSGNILHVYFKASDLVATDFSDIISGTHLPLCFQIQQNEKSSDRCLQAINFKYF